MSWAKIIAIALLIISALIIWMTFDVWAAAFLGLLFALSLNGPAQWIRSKWSMPAWTATLLVMMIVLVVLTGLGFVIGPPLVEQADVLGRELPAAIDKSRDWLEDRGWGRNVVREVESLSGVSSPQLNGEGDANDQPKVSSRGDDNINAAQSAQGTGNDNGNGGSTEDAKSIILPVLRTLVTMLSVTAWTATLLLVSFVVTMYVALNPDIYQRGIIWMIPSRHETVATTTMSRMATALRWWMMGRLCSMVVVGLLTSLGMWLIGMPAPLALGALAGILSFVPNIGPIVAAVPGLLLAVPEGPWMFLYVMGVYLVAQLIESNLITPLVDQFTVTVPPAVLIFVQVLMGVLGGAWGVVIATPLLVVVMVLTQQLYVREYIQKSITVIGSNEDDSPADDRE